MVSSLAKIISQFPGAASRARCTAHIVNLVTKIILRQFDAKKKTKGPKKKSANTNEENANENANDEAITEQVDDEDDSEMTSLAEGLDREEQELGDDIDEEMSENVADDLEEIEEAMKDEVSEVVKKAKPIQRVLFKVRSSYSLFRLLIDILLYYYQLRKLAYAIKRSTTILLPRWKEVLEEFAAAAIAIDKKPLSVRVMPRDVSTRWNSTYDMLRFAYSYREAIDKITGERAMKLRDYELTESEWETVMQLRDCLKVRVYIIISIPTDLSV
jgi:hypothetical protein